MKTLKVFLSGQKYEIELEDAFYEFIKDDIEKLNLSKPRDILNLILSLEYKVYENSAKTSKILEKLQNCDII